MTYPVPALCYVTTMGKGDGNDSDRESALAGNDLAGNETEGIAMSGEFMGVPWRRITTNEELGYLALSLEGAPRLAVDTETTGLDVRTCQIRLVQLGTETEAYVIDGSLDLSMLRRVLADTRTLKIIHNATYDVPVLHFAAGLEVVRYVCTLTLEFALIDDGLPNPRPVGLNPSVQRRLRVVLPKGLGKEFASGAPLEAKHYEYAARDAVVLPKLLRVQEDALKREGKVNLALERTAQMRAKVDALLAQPA